MDFRALLPHHLLPSCCNILGKVLLVLVILLRASVLRHDEVGQVQEALDDLERLERAVRGLAVPSPS